MSTSVQTERVLGSVRRQNAVNDGPSRSSRRSSPVPRALRAARDSVSLEHDLPTAVVHGERRLGEERQRDEPAELADIDGKTAHVEDAHDHVVLLEFADGQRRGARERQGDFLPGHSAPGEGAAQRTDARRFGERIGHDCRPDPTVEHEAGLHSADCGRDGDQVVKAAKLERGHEAGAVRAIAIPGQLSIGSSERTTCMPAPAKRSKAASAS